ncbi:MAG: hypothetical protein COA49_03640 [Bacteroidetes bacterium]|nr:MAG: hypothetical protein COA49_03640 [Bacteroidota bacterium]
MTGSHFNQTLKQMVDCEIMVNVSIPDSSIIIYVEDGLGYVAYTLNGTLIETMKAVFQKYFDWEKQAIEMGVEISKAIQEFRYINSAFKYGNGEWSFDSSGGFNCSFFSQSKTNHQLVFSFDKLQSNSNQFITHKPENIYLSNSQVLELSKGFDYNFIKEFLQKATKQQSIEDSFN